MDMLHLHRTTPCLKRAIHAEMFKRKQAQSCLRERPAIFSACSTGGGQSKNRSLVLRFPCHVSGSFDREKKTSFRVRHA